MLSGTLKIKVSMIAGPCNSARCLHVWNSTTAADKVSLNKAGIGIPKSMEP